MISSTVSLGVRFAFAITVCGALACGCGVSDSKKANKKAQAVAAATPSSGGGPLSAPIDVFWEPTPLGTSANPSGGGQGPLAWYQGNDPKNPLKTHTLEEVQVVEQLLAAINLERSKAGVKPLIVDTGATKAGKAHAEDMAERAFFGHVTPEGRSPEDRLKLLAVIGYTAVGENIAAEAPGATEVVAAWMKSDDHRKNMLSTAFTHMGVGVASKGPQYVAVFLTR